MKLYPKGSWGLLSQLINESNPGLNVDLNESNALVLEKPNGTNLGNSVRNSRIRINGSGGSGVKGKAEFFYDRISLSVVFRYPISITASPTVKKLSDLIPDLNEFLGITLVKEDLAEPDKAPGYGYEETVVDINISPDSFCYRGKIQILWSRRPAGIFPDSGPGTKVLRVGDLKEGYFGVVSASEMVSLGEIYREMIYGTSLMPTPLAGVSWVKFALDGDFYFFPMTMFFKDAAWSEIAEMEAVGGERKEPLICKHPEKTFYFVPSLPSIGKNDPTLLDKKDPTTVAARVFDKLHKGANGNAEWDTLTSRLGIGEVFWWKNAKATADEVKPAFYTDITRDVDAVRQKTLKGNWRPLLRLVNPENYRYRLRNIGSTVVGKLRAPAMSIDANAVDEDMPVRLRDIQYKYAVSITAPVANVTQKPMLAVTGFEATPLGAVTVGPAPVLGMTITRVLPLETNYIRTDKPMYSNVTEGHIVSLVAALTTIHGPTISSFESIFRKATDLSQTDGELGLFD
ncbi:MAG: hypothetical protein ACRDBQ_19040 [Shewanella sp.]